ncbi:MAG: hypothetical protein U1E54_04630 [Candidatus Levybacteria bacterium]|nr:hypothetical protein [Candidatus Levybacteria bacterium]
MAALRKIKLKVSSFLPTSVFQENDYIVLLCQNKNGLIRSLVSEDGFDFKISDKKYTTPSYPEGFPNAVIVPNADCKSKKVMFFGNRSINVAYSDTGESWNKEDKPLIISPQVLEVGNVFVSKQGLLLLYFGKRVKDGITYYDAYLALLDKKTQKLIWKTDKPIWKHQDLWPKQAVRFIGSILLNKTIIIYFLVDLKVLYAVALSGFKYDPSYLSRGKLDKHVANPIISPKTENSWEAFNTFNPAALQIKGKVHILYRAQGFDYISSVGYAFSNDGICIDERLSKPIFVPSMHFESNNIQSADFDYMSGGGFGGCEDPRVTLMGNKVYMVYVAFDGWMPPRLAMTSILLNDFLNKRWLWSKPVLISPPGIVDKSGCLLPEKINGKYVFFHRVYPNILIDYVDDLNFDGKTKFLRGQYKIAVRQDKWDSRKIGVGAPPIKTKDGWLLIYYAVDNKNDKKYQVGAMLLDLKNPTKVLYRTDQPIMKPDKDYECNGFKPGVVYPCGAVVIDRQLLVYYGGADSCVCVATTDLDLFLKKLKAKKPILSNSIKVKEITI